MFRSKDSKRRNLAARMGRWSAAHWKTATFGWLALVAVAFAVYGQVSTKTVDPYTAGPGESGRMDRILNDGFKQPAGENVVIQNRSLRAGDPAFYAAVADVVARVSKVAAVQNVHRGEVSKDKHTALVKFEIRGDKNKAGDKVDSVLNRVDDAQRAHPGFFIGEFGDASAQKAVDQAAAKDLKSAGVFSIPITLIILVVAFGALVAAGIPLLLALTAVLITIGFLALPSQLLPIAQEVTATVLLIGLAVGVDYSMFYLRREREERAAGRSERAALEAAAATSGRSVLISGLTVLVAMAGLFLTGDKTFASFGVATMLVVAVAMLGSLTVLPALLSKLGDKVDRLRVPHIRRLRRGSGEGRVWGAIVDRVLRRPVLSVVVSAAVLLALAAPALGLRMVQPGPDTYPQSLDIIKAYNRMEQAFPGTSLPANVVVKAPNVKAPAVRNAIRELENKALATGRVGKPITVETNPDGTVANITVPIKGKGTEAAQASLAALRDIVPQTVGALPGTKAGVTGQTAEWRDSQQELKAKLPIVVGFVLLFAFVLLLVSFRSIVVAIKAIVLNLLSVGAAYGVLVLVFQDGFGRGLLGFSDTSGITPVVPMLLFVILFGLSMDYHVLIVSRIREAFQRGAGMDEAISVGIKSTAGVVTSAAVVMVGVFSVFGALSLLMFKQFGVGLAVAILIDATIVRGVLLPATMKLLGDWNWYLPRWLEWLPRGDKGSEPAPDASPAVVYAEAEPKKRTGLTVGAWVVVVLGALALAAGGTGIWANTKRDDNGYFSAKAHRYRTHTRAIATENITVGSYVPTWLAGKVRLDVSGYKPLFVGIAPKATVDSYLARIEHTEATNLGLDPFKVTYVDHAGSADPGRPATKPFWAATVSGTNRPLTWKLRSGTWSIVVMNADGSRGVAATIGVGVKVPALLWVGIGLSLFGGALLATARFMFAARSRSYRRAEAAPVLAD